MMGNKCLMCGKQISKEHNQKVCLDCRKDYYKKSKLKSAKDYYKKHKEEKRKYDKKRAEEKLKQKLKKLKRKCVICKKFIKFKKENLNSKTCCKKCSKKLKNLLTSNLISKKYDFNKKNYFCVKCGKEINPNKYGSNFTCLKCNLIEVKRGRKRLNGVSEKRFEIVKCIICGRNITDRISLAKYCEKCFKDLAIFCKRNKISYKQGVTILKNKDGK